jgi:glycosyltransferase involved in cell wall biosynthesis
MKLSTLKNGIAYLAWAVSGRRPLGRVLYIGEGGDWVIGRIGRRLSELMNARGIPFFVRESSRFASGSVLHFGSVHSFAHSGMHWVGKGNRIIVTLYHSNRGISPEMDASIDLILRLAGKIDAVITSASIMEDRLASWGFPAAKISRIPIAVDVGNFRVPAAESRIAARLKHGIPPDAICIGSFQKDGQGWGEGTEPKWIKGPDVFVDAVSRLAEKHKVICLLTGPSRGFVKERLREKGIPFVHVMVEDYAKIGGFYGCLDLYLVTSREEGGPLALMECMATGVPLVSTRVGMAPDIVTHGENGFLAEIGDAAGIAEYGDRIIRSGELREKFRMNGLKKVVELDYAALAGRYEALYRSLMPGGR